MLFFDCSLSLLKRISVTSVVHEQLFSQAVQRAEHHIWRWRKVRRDRWPHTGRSKSFTETWSVGPRTWNSWSVTSWLTMWPTQVSNVGGWRCVPWRHPHYQSFSAGAPEQARKFWNEWKRLECVWNRRSAPSSSKTWSTWGTRSARRACIQLSPRCML